MQPKKIIIVGASSGIGRELACIYASRRSMVGITGRRQAKLEEVQSEFPEQIITSCFDVTGPTNRDAIQSLINELGGLDLLIYNAGFGEPSDQLEWNLENVTTKTNVSGFVEIVSYAFNYFFVKGRGQIAVTSSIASLRGSSWAPAYSASKAFMCNYAEGLNMKARRQKKNIVITALVPGFMDTKPSKGNPRFWVIPMQKAARQIVRAIDKKKRKAYISRRWWLVAQVMKMLPFNLYRRIA